MKAKIKGFEVEGTPTEILIFLREYLLENPDDNNNAVIETETPTETEIQTEKPQKIVIVNPVPRTYESGYRHRKIKNDLEPAFDKIKKMLDEGHTIKFIAQKYKVNYDTMKTFLHKHNIYLHPRQTYSEEMKNQMRQLHKAGMSGIEIANTLKIPKHYVYSNLSFLDDYEKFKKPKEVISNGKIEKIKTLIDKGIDQKTIAKLLSITPATVSKYKLELGYKKYSKPKANTKISDDSGYRKFKSERIKYHMKYHGMDYFKASQMANDEWNGGRGRNVASLFPEFVSIKEKQYLDVLETAIRNMIREKGKLNYVTLGMSIGFESTYAWQGFLLEFTQKIKMICDYFNVANHFKVNVNDMSITYQEA